MFKTKLTEALDIKYPIIQGGMMWVSRACMASAVSNAGGLGVITALSFNTPEKLALEIDEMNRLTDKPFAVNITFMPTLKPVDYPAYLKVIAEKGVKIIETAGRNPEPYMDTIKSAGIKVIHKCTSVKHALKAEDIGCDFISIDGFECAGHPGEDDVTSLILIPLAADALKIPVIASGGFGDARGLVASLALGAEGVNMGTRFLATQEAPVHEKIKNLIVSSTERDTILVERSIKNTVRVLNNQHAQTIKEMEANGASLMELAPLLSGLRGKHAIETGESDEALMAIGQIIGLINTIPTVKDLIENIINESRNIINNKLSSM